ncbi:hypothetical protein ACSRUE_20305 [Sorangium sp. KYC3313]
MNPIRTMSDRPMGEEVKEMKEVKEVKEVKDVGRQGDGCSMMKI